MSTTVEAPPKVDIQATRPLTTEIPRRMKAAVYTAYGPPEVIEIREVDTPVPSDDEVLMRVSTAALNPLDWRVMRGGALPFRLMFGWSRPKSGFGRDVAGTVLAVGGNVKQFKPGDNVFGGCIGAVAEYACAVESKIALKPDGVTWEQAASIPVAGMTALQGLRDYGVTQGTKVLINGAAGGVGTFAVQLGKWLGAEVTAVCSTRNIEMVRSLGADRVIDYTCEEFTAGTEQFDVILDNVGNVPLAKLKRVLSANGKVVMAGAPKEPWAIARRFVRAWLLSAFSARKFTMMMARIGTKDLEIMADLAKSHKVVPVVEQCYALAEIRDAVRYLETGHVRGKLIISIS